MCRFIRAASWGRVDMQSSKNNLEVQACCCFPKWKFKINLEQELNIPAQISENYLQKFLSGAQHEEAVGKPKILPENRKMFCPYVVDRIQPRLCSCVLIKKVSNILFYLPSIALNYFLVKSISFSVIWYQVPNLERQIAESENDKFCNCLMKGGEH